MIKRVRLTTSITLLFVMFAAALLLGVGILAYLSGRESLQQATIAELEATAREKEDAVARWGDERKGDLTALAAMPVIIGDVSILVSASASPTEVRAAHDRIRANLAGWASQRPETLTMALMDPGTGQVLVANQPADEGKFWEDRPYFINGLTGAYFENPYYSVNIQNIAVAASAPVRDVNGKTLAVLATQLSVDGIDHIITQRTGLHSSDEVFLVSPTGLFVTQPRFISDPATLRLGPNTNAVKQCLAHNSGVAFENDYRGVPAIKVYHWLAERELCLVAKIDQDEAFAPINAFGRTLALIGVATLLAAAGAAYWLARSITKPVLALTTGAIQFGQGDFGLRLPETSSDELGVLAHAFNTMAASIAAKEAQLQNRTELLEQANKELEAFSYSVSHDLRAPLRSMDGFSKLLLSGYPSMEPEKATHYLERIRENAQKMGQLIDDLLTFSRLNRAPLNFDAAQPVKLVQQVLDDLKDEQSGRNVEIVIGNLPDCRADPALLRQVYANLLGNALKYTRRRDPARIEVNVVDQDGKCVYFVRDNGAGFDMQYADKLFGVFQRFHRAEDYEGTGVGLATVQRIIYRHGGRVWAEAAVDKGATFYFTLGETNNE